MNLAAFLTPHMRAARSFKIRLANFGFDRRFMDQKDEPAANGTASPASWWIWSGWLRQDASTPFVYGCAARCWRAPGWSQDGSLELADCGQLEIRQRTVTDDAFQAFQDQLNAGAIALELLFGPGAPNAAIKAKRLIVQWGLGHSAARVTAFYSL